MRENDYNTISIFSSQLAEDCARDDAFENPKCLSRVAKKIRSQKGYRRWSYLVTGKLVVPINSDVYTIASNFMSCCSQFSLQFIYSKCFYKRMKTGL